ncbi:hypothetical protein F2Q68_00025539 [Brassica cretica]|uniref:RRM domain-containing protein n=1 Tax=Brassica cretica TaxID=69181 RepID=A0A8S9IEN1_BRACR|nr:hypothetical protein F2Q68_00025539 [Brassica cretica]
MGLRRLGRAIGPLLRVVESTPFSRSFDRLKVVLSRAVRSLASRRAESFPHGYGSGYLSCGPFGRTRSVNVSDLATVRDIQEFFSFSGNIDHIDILK